MQIVQIQRSNNQHTAWSNPLGKSMHPLHVPDQKSTKNF